MENMRSFHAVVFDFDGALAELTLDFDDMKRRIGALAGEYLGAARTPSGLPALEWVEELRAEIALLDVDGAPDRFRTRAHALIEEMETAAASERLLFPYTRPTLSELAARGVKTAIISRNCRRAIDRVFPDALRYVGVVAAREDAIRVKPDPEHLLQALRALGVAPSRALMVGDHPMDIKTGKAAKTASAGVASGRTSREELARSGADFTAGDAAELLETLKKAGAV